MNYEIVNLKEKKLVGVSAVTGNNDPKMCEIIGELWYQLYQGGVIGTIKNKINDYSIGLYSDYKDDTYCVTAGAEVSEADNSELSIKIIPAGKYAKFSVYGDVQKAVSEAWEEIWKMDLPRSFTGDFEEYLSNDGKNADIDIYIALKD